MIQKSKSRKDKSFSQLMRYFLREQTAGQFSWNLYSNSQNTKEIVQEFIQNSHYLNQARGKVFMYHEILSLQENNLSKERQVEILQELTRQYVMRRAEKHLVYGVIHQDTKHLHMHLMISANKVAQQKRVRLSRQEFKQIQMEIEQHKNRVYKQELEQTHFYTQGQSQEQQKTKGQEQEMKHKRKVQTKKEWLQEQLQGTFNRCFSKQALEKSFQEQGFELYQRGKSLGIIFENKKYRLKTLGLEQEYKQVQKQFEQKEQRQEKRQEFKQRQQQTRKKANYQEFGQGQTQR